MKFTTFVYGLKAAALAGSFLLLINPAAAQDEAVNSIEEVIVTSQRVEESLHEKMPVARSFPSSNENKDMEEIEGDVIPRWLMNDEEEIDSSDSMLAEISIKIEGGTY